MFRQDSYVQRHTNIKYIIGKYIMCVLNTFSECNFDIAIYIRINFVCHIVLLAILFCIMKNSFVLHHEDLNFFYIVKYSLVVYDHDTLCIMKYSLVVYHEVFTCCV